jgi:hypothetical protein
MHWIENQPTHMLLFGPVRLPPRQCQARNYSVRQETILMSFGRRQRKSPSQPTAASPSPHSAEVQKQAPGAHCLSADCSSPPNRSGAGKARDASSFQAAGHSGRGSLRPRGMEPPAALGSPAACRTPSLRCCCCRGPFHAFDTPRQWASRARRRASKSSREDGGSRLRPMVNRVLLRVPGLLVGVFVAIAFVRRDA